MTLQIDIQFQDNSIINPPEKRYTGYRYLHRAEGGNQQQSIPDVPEVGAPINFAAVEMTREIQIMSWKLMKYFNGTINEQQWTKVYRYDKAFTNKNGFERNGDPRRNYILGTNLNSPNLPKYDKAQRVSGGQFLRGIPMTDRLICVPGVHGIDANKPLPSLETIVKNNWYLLAVTLHEFEQPVGHFPQGNGGPVAIPFIFSKTIEFPLWWFEIWDKTELPDVLRFYK